MSSGLAFSPAFAACGRVELGSTRLDTEAVEAEQQPGPAEPTEGPSPLERQADAAASAPIELGSEALDASADASGDAAIPLDPDPSPPSCRGATEFCGRNSESCCLSLPVAGGPLALPIDAAGTRVQVELSSYRLDKFEVTVGRFREFLAGYDAWRERGNPVPGAGRHPHAPDSGWRANDDAALPASSADFERIVRECNTIPLSTLDLPNSSSRIPLNCVTWPEAAAFCAWDDARLPTYAEWYYAAAGGAQDRLYPWGNEPTPSRAYALYGCTLGLERPECTAAYVLPVGSHPNGAGLFEQEDLAGSMTEWLLDGALEPFVDGCLDCVGVPSTPHRFWKGGSWVDSPLLLENNYFAIVEQTLRLPFLGVRCARDER